MNKLSQLSIPVDLAICSVSLPADELLALTEGSVVPVTCPEDRVLTLMVGGEPFADAHLIRRENGYYIQIKKFHEPETSAVLSR
jgi:flagellar motor switch/type III secretory pathway protein FliN